MDTLKSEMQLIRWQDLDSEKQSTLRMLTVSDQQIEYSGTITKAISVCESVDNNGVSGLAVVYKNIPVGFIVLHKRQLEWALPGSVGLTAMQIDRRFQGKGIGKKALLAAEEWVSINWPEVKIISLCVDDGNDFGCKTYERLGYSDYSEPKLGRIGKVRYLAKSIN